MKLYIDGELVSECDYNYTDLRGVDRGIRHGRTLDGQMDEARVYNVALNQAYIQELYNETTYGAFCSIDFCGDGVTLGSETCDDGNILSGDGCSATCTVETVQCTDTDLIAYWNYQGSATDQSSNTNN